MQSLAPPLEFTVSGRKAFHYLPSACRSVLLTQLLDIIHTKNVVQSAEDSGQSNRWGWLQVPAHVVQGESFLFPREGLLGGTHQWSRGAPRAPPGQPAWPPVLSCPRHSSQTRRSCSWQCRWPQAGETPAARAALRQGESRVGSGGQPALLYTVPVTEAYHTSSIPGGEALLEPQCSLNQASAYSK